MYKRQVVLQFIKEFNKDILIDWIVEETYKELLEYHPEIHQLHLTKLRKAKKKKSFLMLLTELNKVRKLGPYDIIIDMQGLVKSALIAKLIPGKKVIGFDKESSREGFASLFYSDKFNCAYTKNVIERNIALVEFSLGFSVDYKQIQNKAPFLFPKKNQLRLRASNIKKNVILIPGASHFSKSYPPLKLAKLATLIDADFFIIWGNQKEKAMANEIKNLANNVNICNKLELDSLIWLISKVDLVIGPDTGPTHIAWAINIPSITLFGPTPGYRNTFETIINRIIESNSTVDPYNIDKKDNSIKNIEVQKILKMSKELLEINKK